MSIAVMTEVWKDAPVAGTELLMLLALADSCNDDRECWPSLRHLQHKVRVSRNQTYKLLKSLERQGLIEIGFKQGRGKPGMESNMYCICPMSGIPQDTTPGIPQDTTPGIPQDTLNHLSESSSETIVPNGNVGVEESKKPRERNLVFDAVAQHIFEIDPTETNGEGGRIGILASWLNGKSDGVKHGKTKVTVGFISAPAKPEHVIAFAGYWRSTSKANIPYDLQKFVDAWRKWVSGLKNKNVRREQQNGSAVPEVQLSVNEVEARRQQLAAARNGEQSQ